MKPALFSANSDGACPTCNGVGVLYSLLLAPISLVLFATTIRREDER